MSASTSQRLNEPEGPALLSEAESRLERVLGELTDRLRRGQAVNLEAAIALHPDLADDLRQLWPAVVLAEELAPPLAAEDETTLKPQGSTAKPVPFTKRTFGDYELLEELGRGGMGVVYRAWQKSLARTVALKMMLSVDASQEELLRFKAEAAAIGRLDHPNLVPIYESGEVDGIPYFSMKYVEGQTLAQRVAEAPLPAREAAAILLKVADAIEHAHSKGILHRDLKPSNILIDSNGEPHVTDFGLAKDVGSRDELKRERDPNGELPPFHSITATGAIIGTPSYMPPEQAARTRGKLSPASDVYSLGAILYFMLTGRPPFAAASLVDTLMLVLEQEPVAPRMLNPKVDRDLEIICLKCLQKPADLRYGSAAALAMDLRSYLAGESISAGPRSLFGFISRMLRPTHHEAVLENWGLLWIWHSLMILALCGFSNVMKWIDVTAEWTYPAFWTAGLITWAFFFWEMRKRGGPISFVERQIAHVWAAAVLAAIFMFLIEMIMGLNVLTLSPLLAVFAGMVFLVKAGMLSGTFYINALVLFATSLVMAAWTAFDLITFGVVSAVCFFIPGLKYYRQRLRSIADAKGEEGSHIPAPLVPAAPSRRG